MLFVLALLLAAAPQRIVSTTPSITELLFALGAGNRVVGVTNYCRHPAQARTLPKIGTYIQPDLERIAALKPELVVIQKNPVQLRARLERLGLRVLELQYDSIAETFAAINALAEAVGAAGQGHALRAKIDRELTEIRNKVQGRAPKSLVFIIGRNPGTVDGLVAAGRTSYLSELMEVAGGRNAFADSIAPYPKITLEELFARNPEVIVDMGDMAATEKASEAERKAVIQLWSRYEALRAVREGRVFVVADDMFVVPGPRMVEAAREFARMLHPEVFR